MGTSRENSEFSTHKVDDVATAFRDEMIQRYGPMISNVALAELLEFGSAVTLRRAIASKKIPIQLFQIGKSRNYFAITNQVVEVILNSRHAISIDEFVEVEEGKA